jgi:phosphoribosyl 1,2-cyclic phosphodiesterase
MALYITSLNSGSNGNCYYVGNETDAVLIDAGLSCRETEKRMRSLDLDMKLIRAIFVSHEHGDHIKGVTNLANKYKLPVYITEKTARFGPRMISHISQRFTAKQTISIGSLSVTPFTKFHDASDPHSFIISYKHINVGVLTDIGKVCPEVIHHFSQCHAVFLESNYDESMLENGRYPIHLKNRIRGGLGHLSNKEALELFKTHRSPSLSHLLLAHLSQENNSPELAASLFEPHANGTKVIVASRFQPTEVFKVTNGDDPIREKKVYLKPLQLGLFN